MKLLKVIKNPITDHLPTGCLKIGNSSCHLGFCLLSLHHLRLPPATSYSSKQLVKLPQYAATVGQDRPVCFVVGAIAHGELNVPWVDETVAVSQYAMSAAGVCAKLTDAFEQTWGIH